MILRTALAALLLACAGCSKAETPLERAADQVKWPISETTVRAIEAVAAALPPASNVEDFEPRIHPEAVALIVRWEVTSPATYTRKYQGVIYPGGASGPTWGVGYDGGHMTRNVIASDWKDHAQVDRLIETSGITGKRAKDELHRWRGVLTPYEYAYLIFSTKTLIEYERRTRRAFPGYDQLRPRAKGALVSLVYNRGDGKAGDSRREVREIEACVPKQDYACIARAIRSMKRLWVGTPIEAGLAARREAEAVLVEKTES